MKNKIYIDHNRETGLWEVKVVKDFYIFEYIIEKFEFSTIQGAIKKCKSLSKQHN